MSEEFTVKHPINISSFPTVGEAILAEPMWSIRRWLLKCLLPRNAFDEAEVSYYVKNLLENGAVIASVNLTISGTTIDTSAEPGLFEIGNGDEDSIITHLPPLERSGDDD